jgi:hypothetical protein
VTCKERLRAHSGFTLAEVLIATTILVLGVLATMTVVSAAQRASAVNRQRDTATNLAREVVEAVRTVPYDRLTDTSVTTELKRVPGLEDRAGGGYDVERGPLVLDIAVDVCVVDDATDGGGPRSATGTFCPNSTPAGTQDKNPEDYKKVTVTITWPKTGGSTGTVTQTGIVTNPGSASGPAVRTITPQPLVVTNPGTTNVVIDLTTSSKPSAINWLLDGSVQQPSPVAVGTTGLSWQVVWDIGDVNTGKLDGDYIVSGEAFNEYGVSGPSRQETVTLNRWPAFKPAQVAGGRTQFGTVEIEWTANRERDIVGYEVTREGAAAPVCPLQTQKLDEICVDPAPPAGPSLKYRVRAYDKDPVTGAPRAGELSEPLAVVDDNTPPFPPATLSGTRAADGTVTLTWQRPSPGDPDAGDDVAFYRIYRDGQAYGDRFARWYDDRATVAWQDTATGGTTHSYSVTAVDRRYAESPFLGPVTL